MKVPVRLGAFGCLMALTACGENNGGNDGDPSGAAGIGGDSSGAGGAVAGEAGDAGNGGTGGAGDQAGQGGEAGAPPLPAVSRRQIGLGIEHGCAIDQSMTIVCWGEPIQDNGQVAPPAGSFVHLRSYGRTNCALNTADQFDCWGEPDWISKGANTADFAIGYRHACVLTLDGAIHCYGDPGAPEGVSPDGTFREVVAGSNITCGLTTDLSLSCWGNDDHGITSVPAGEFVHLAVGDDHACAIRREDRSVACWGAGGPNDPNFEQPNGVHFGQSIPPAGAFVDIAAGNLHTCGIREDGTVACWGAGTITGDCTATIDECGQADPVGGTFRQLAAGYSHSCGLLDDGSIACWGSNTGNRATPPTDFRAW